MEKECQGKEICVLYFSPTAYNTLRIFAYDSRLNLVSNTSLKRQMLESTLQVMSDTMLINSLELDVSAIKFFSKTEGFRFGAKEEDALATQVINQNSIGIVSLPIETNKGKDIYRVSLYNDNVKNYYHSYHRVNQSGKNLDIQEIKAPN